MGREGRPSGPACSRGSRPTRVLAVLELKAAFPPMPCLVAYSLYT